MENLKINELKEISGGMYHTMQSADSVYQAAKYLEAHPNAMRELKEEIKELFLDYLHKLKL